MAVDHWFRSLQSETSPLMIPRPVIAQDMKRLAALWVMKQDLQVVVAPEVSVYEQGKEYRFDVVGLRPYDQYRLWGFEVKMTRQDFLQDKKWFHYLPFVHLFYFVAPDANVIDPKELPKEVGVLYYHPQSGLRAARKATYQPLQAEPQKLLTMSMMLLRNKVPEIHHFQRILAEQS